MNKNILLVMKWLRDNSSVTKDELGINYDVAANTANAANATVNAAANAANVANANADFWVDECLERSGENKQDYIDAINKELNKC